MHGRDTCTHTLLSHPLSMRDIGLNQISYGQTSYRNLCTCRCPNPAITHGRYGETIRRQRITTTGDGGHARKSYWVSLLTLCPAMVLCDPMAALATILMLDAAECGDFSGTPMHHRLFQRRAFHYYPLLTEFVVGVSAVPGVTDLCRKQPTTGCNSVVSPSHPGCIPPNVCQVPNLWLSPRLFQHSRRITAQSLYMKLTRCYVSTLKDGGHQFQPLVAVHHME